MRNLQNLQSKLDKLIKEDPSEQKNIGTFTAIHKNPFVYQYLFHYLNKNVVDRKGYKSLSYFETIIDKYFKRLFDNKDGSVVLTSGSTESILLAFHYAREKARDEKNITKPNILIPKHAHYSLKRCARMLNIEVKEIKLNNNYTTDIEDVKQKIDENTILIAGIMISTELGVIDDLMQLDAIAKKHNTWIHIDGAIGGFIIPYLDTDIKYKFSQLESLFSMNISCHKFGLSLCGGGILLLRDKQVTQRYTGSIEYLSSGNKKMAGLTVTGSSLGVFSLYTNIMLYKNQGYRNFAKKYIKTKSELMDMLQQFGYSSFQGSQYSPQIFVYGEDAERLSEYLLKRGWLQHAYKVVGLEKEGFRIVIKKDQEQMLLNEFIRDVRDFKLLTNQQLMLQNKFPRTPTLATRVS
ncbi:MAG TPA: aminotransferase class V-fold PLP-dependent enzyme [Candidatus Sulfotelmatobacter sp.]|jgi:tyrosine decarboxylase/aspartate 1-decarboxylase|nr:aminotransferase class V-fold PLP-dependent enzyme [Candidatus Sulfotelmatobacter sp.]